MQAKVEVEKTFWQSAVRDLLINCGSCGVAITHPDSIIDRIYEASVIPEYWPQVLRDFARVAESSDAILILANGPNLRAIGSSAHFEDLAREHYEYPGGHERTRRLLAAQRAGFVTDLEVFAEAEILAEPLFTEFLIPRGYGGGIATAIQVPSGDSVVFHTERPYAEGPFAPETVQQLDALRPHLARASLLSARLGAERARAAAAALEAVGLPAAVLGSGGRTIAANDLLTAMMPDVVQDRPRRLGLTNPAADALLKSAIEAIAASAGERAVCSIPIAASERHPPVIVHLLPVKGAAHDVFVRSSVILVATPVVPKIVPGANVIQALFDLTPAEAKVAHELANGNTSAAIAGALGISVSTVRNQLAAVLTKSGLHRQAELVAMLQGAAVG